MNKILPYIVIAILLGTVTMVVPLALLGPNDHISFSFEDTLTQPSSTEPPTEDSELNSQDRAQIEGGTFDSVPSEPPKLESPPEEIPTTTEPSESEEPEEPPTEVPAPESTFGGTDLTLESLSNLSPIGLITIPSFLIALGAFVILRKRMS